MTDEEASSGQILHGEHPKREIGAFCGTETQMFTVDALSAQYFMAKAAAEHKTTMEIISEMVRERIAASA